MTKIIGFFDNGIGFRGTTRAIIDYSKACFDLNNNIKIKFFFIERLAQNNHSIALEMLRYGIEIEPIKCRDDLKSQKLDFLYHVSSSYGNKNEWLKELPYPTFLHQVGYNPPDVNTSTYFAYTSYWQSCFLSGGNSDVLPYIINAKTHCFTCSQPQARQYFSLPNDAIVLGRHGGLDTWNLPFVCNSVRDTVITNPNIIFLFLNTPKFISHPRVIFIDGSSDNKLVSMYLAACDAMIHARWEGETFGLACAEFLIRKKPIITWAESRERNHILLSDKSCIFFNTEADCTLILSSLTRDYLNYKSSLIPVDYLSSTYSPKVVGQKLLSFL
ncbi:MAG: hypothetical protein CBC25_00420 [Pelagibacteraceae bacterium TMED65]|jgi:hypothetical protein|nr:MAG: hypothetical protein CBC25_00420 [Pelagibacteraceae bacterium TMED65]|tara:strand:- start:3285 stop:4271 length:987 start_codon:yes stop_codon:yes gene_type:complete